MIKWIIGLAIVIVVGAGLWWSGWLSPYFSMKAPAPVAEQATTTPQQQTQQPAATNDLPTQSGDTSDAAIMQDTASIDAQMQGLNSDSTAADQSLQDKATAQEY